MLPQHRRIPSERIGVITGTRAEPETGTGVGMVCDLPYMTAPNARHGMTSVIFGLVSGSGRPATLTSASQIRVSVVGAVTGIVSLQGLLPPDIARLTIQRYVENVTDCQGEFAGTVRRFGHASPYFDLCHRHRAHVRSTRTRT
jgi:hypothetical protein